MSLTPNKLRFSVDFHRFNQDIKDQEGARLQFWRGSPVRLEIAFTEKGLVSLNTESLVSLTVQIKSRDQRFAQFLWETAPLVSKTILASGSEFDHSLTDDAWEDGSGQHVVIAFTGAEMNVPPRAVESSYLVLVAQVSGIDEPITLASSLIGLYEDGYSNAAGPPPSPVESYLSASQTAALIDSQIAQALAGLGFGEGVVLTAPDGVKWKLEITNDGALTQTVVTE
jgi:hypothetical protein